MEYVLQTQALGKNYRKFTALENLTMSVPRGAVYGLVGKNGAGKTTLLRLICKGPATAPTASMATTRRIRILSRPAAAWARW